MGLGLDMGSREGSHLGGRRANETPAIAQGYVMPIDKSRNARVRTGAKRSRGDDDDGEESGDDEDDSKPATKRSGLSIKKSSGNFSGSAMGNGNGNGNGYDVEMVDTDGLGADGEVDSMLYCTCRQVSYGEMIGCDNDDCEIEWVSQWHVFVVVGRECR